MTTPRSPLTYGLYRYLPSSVYGPEPQNPAPMDLHGQIDADRVKSLAEQIVRVFLNSLPSNYVSQTKGPYYVQQFQAAAEELARIQVLLMDAYEDSDFDFTRTEVLFQFLATLVFPDASTNGLPEIDGDITYREFLKRMVALLLQGSKKTSLVGGLEALTDANITLLEKVRYQNNPGTLWTLADQFMFEVNVEKFSKTGPTSGLSVTSHYHTVSVNTSGVGTTLTTSAGTEHTHTITNFVVDDAYVTGTTGLHTHDLISTFPDLPIVLQRNAALVLAALDPAHTLYEYRNLFRESLTGRVTDSITGMDLTAGFYEDFRRDCTGIKQITGTAGWVGTDRYLFHDPTLSFRSVRVGSELIIPVVPTPAPSTHLPREHRYTVTEILSFPYGDDPVGYVYSTSPTGLNGTAIVENEAFVDPLQDFSACQAGETLTLTGGPNAGTYLLDSITGIHGGPLGSTATPFGPSTGVRPVPSWLRVTPKIVASGTNLGYTITLDKLGVRVPLTVINEDASWYFFGPGASSTLLTQHGPLVKAWGDATPAGIPDVVVRYDGTPVTVSGVNPYTGEVTLAAPLGPFAPGAHTVTVTYRWFTMPVLGMAGLNTKGLTLNNWSLRRGRNTTTTTLNPASGLYGGFHTSRFPMGVTLGRFSNRRPAFQVSHRYIGFEKGYTASLNSPTTLLLNQSPGRMSVPFAETDRTPQSFTYDGNGIPDGSWTSVGNVQETLTGGYYTLIDADGGQMAYWKRDFSLPISTNVTMGARIEITQYTLDGVFTGVGFGFHNNQRLFLAGALKVTNPVAGGALRHIGLLLRPGDPSELSSWEVGPSVVGEVQRPSSGTTYNTVTVPTASLPTMVSVGNKFQVLSGNQAKVYTITDLYSSTRTGKTYLVVTPPFPADPTLFGNRDVTMVFDTAWDGGLCTWRLYANTRSGALSVVFGGSSGSTTTLTTGTAASPAYLGPDVLPEGYGRVVWGSFSRGATNTATWDFLRVASLPDGGYAYSRGSIVDTEWAYGTITCRTPQVGDTFTIDASPAPLGGPTVTFIAGTDFTLGATDSITATNIAAAINASLLAPNFVSATSSGVVVTITTNTSGSPGTGILFSTVSGGRMVLSGATFTGNATDPEYGSWYLATPFGDTRTSGSLVTITSTPASDSLGAYYGYKYTDPFLNGRRVCALDAKVLVSRDTAGVGGATLSIQDTHKEARLGSIRWEDRGVLGKRIFRNDTVSLLGSIPYWHQDWDGLVGDNAFPNGPETILTCTGDGWSLYRNLTPLYCTGAGRFLEFRLSVKEYDFLVQGFHIACTVSSGPTRVVYFVFQSGAVALTDSPGGLPLGSATVAWEDGNPRTYRVTHNVVAGTVTLHVDGVLGATVALAAFGSPTVPGDVSLEAYSGATSFTINLHSITYGNTDEGVTGLGRTFGLWKGGDVQDLDNWVIPRSDGLDVPNSDPSSVFVSMDWSTSCWVRIFLDPTYGAAFIRPDLAPPPGYTGDFATQSMNPSAGWVTIEYARLPRTAPVEQFGTVSFGALNPNGSVLATWAEARYRMFTNTTVDYSAPPGMVLNRWNVITSNEFARDTTPEVVVVSSVTQTRVSLRPCHIFADRVFAVEIDGAVIPQSLWTFNKASQEVTLLAGVPAAGYPVTVTFAPARPVTNTYLEAQPLAQSQNLLNEGTPTFQETQSGTAVYTTITGNTVSGSGGRTPVFPPAGPSNPEYFLRDQYVVRKFSDEDEYLYERMEFHSLDNDGQTGRLSTYCEGGPGANGTWGVTEFGFAPTGEGSSGGVGGGGALTDSFAHTTSVGGYCSFELLGGTRYGRNQGPGQFRYILQPSGASFNGGVLNTTSFQNPTTGVIAPFSGATPVTTEAEARMLYPTTPVSGGRGMDYGGLNRETLFVLRTGAPPGTVTIWTGGDQSQRWG